MRVKGSYDPPPFSLEELDNGRTALLRFYDNVTEYKDKETNTSGWEWDEYVLRVRNDVNLFERIKRDVGGWIKRAKDNEREELAAQVRAERNRLLAETDVTQLADTPLSDSLRAKYKEYRQALRNIPEQEGFPFDVIYPEKPITVVEVLDNRRVAMLTGEAAAVRGA